MVEVITGTDAFVAQVVGVLVVIAFGVVLILLRKAFKDNETYRKFITSSFFTELYSDVQKLTKEKAQKAAVEEARKRNIKTFDWVPKDIVMKYGDKLEGMSKEKIEELIEKEKEHGRNDESSSGDKV